MGQIFPWMRDGFLKYSADSLAEAQLKYPTDSRVQQWLWAETYTRVESQSLGSDELFSNLLVDALNAGEVSFTATNLQQWFYEYPPYDFKIQTDSLEPLVGYISSHIVTITGYFPGGTTFWVLETSDGYFTYPLYSNLGDRHASGYEWEIIDLTGDGINDLLVSATIHNGTFIGEDLIVFDLSSASPRRLSFEPSNSFALEWSHYTSVEMQDGEPILKSVGGTPICPGSFSTTHIWNGQWFEQVAFESEWLIDLGACIYAIEGRSLGTEFEHKRFIEWLEGEVGETVPGGEDFRTGELYALDVIDEFRYLLAINYAELGEVSKARAYLEQVISMPSIPESSWIEPAEQFVSQYQSAEDVYQACITTHAKCNMRLSVERVASTLEVYEFDSAVERFVELGVPVVANGRFNFYHDSRTHQWFIIQHQPGGELELWILSISDTRVKAMFVDVVDSLNPDLLLYIPSRDHYPIDNNISQFTIGNGAIYNFIRRQRDQEPYITKQNDIEPYLIRRDSGDASLERIIDELLAGTNPEEILLWLQNWAGDPDYEVNNRYYYYLGLCHELLGDEDSAINAYLIAWQNCCDITQHHNQEIVTANPYAIMARAKLEPVP
ncbi:MAG: hypothetical protein GY943_33885 [Chloroflexi bacterium]|nr:hypothetical protein [Chloroflexota bacterium]